MQLLKQFLRLYKNSTKNYTQHIMKTSLLRVFLSLVIIVLLSLPSKACSPLAVPTLVSQAVAGTNLNLNWTGSTTYTCGYNVEVEIACNTSSFTGTGTPAFYSSATVTPSGTIPYTYPMQSINISTLCPGTVYKFRAREVYHPPPIVVGQQHLHLQHQEL